MWVRSSRTGTFRFRLLLIPLASLVAVLRSAHVPEDLCQRWKFRCRASPVRRIHFPSRRPLTPTTTVIPTRNFWARATGAPTAPATSIWPRKARPQPLRAPRETALAEAETALAEVETALAEAETALVEVETALAEAWRSISRPPSR